MFYILPAKNVECARCSSSFGMCGIGCRQCTICITKSNAHHKLYVCIRPDVRRCRHRHKYIFLFVKITVAVGFKSSHSSQKVSRWRNAGLMCNVRYRKPYHNVVCVRRASTKTHIKTQCWTFCRNHFTHLWMRLCAPMSHSISLSRSLPCEMLEFNYDICLNKNDDDDVPNDKRLSKCYTCVC